jgi:hypothetical protein
MLIIHKNTYNAHKSQEKSPELEARDEVSVNVRIVTDAYVG